MYLVVGTGRSGTTEAARVLQECLGVDMGGPGRVSESNTRGDYEAKWARALTLEYLRGHRPLHSWRLEMLRRAREMQEPWGLKVPVSAYMLDEWLRMFRRARIIWAQRDFDDTVGSFLRWYKQGANRARMDVGARLHLLGHFLQGVDHLVIDYTDRVPEEETVRRITEKWPGVEHGLG